MFNNEERGLQGSSFFVLYLFKQINFMVMEGIEFKDVIAGDIYVLVSEFSKGGRYREWYWDGEFFLLVNNAEGFEDMSEKDLKQGRFLRVGSTRANYVQ